MSTRPAEPRTAAGRLREYLLDSGQMSATILLDNALAEAAAPAGLDWWTKQFLLLVRDTSNDPHLVKEADARLRQGTDA